MIEIEPQPWATMVDHAQNIYPNECCGAMLGRTDGEKKVVTEAVPLENAFAGEQGERYKLRPEDLLAADQAARDRGLNLIWNFPLASGLRCLLFGNGFEELVPVVLLCGAFN